MPRELNLKRCPFCGGMAEIVYKENGYEYTDPNANYYPLKQGTIRCCKCGLRLPRFWAAETAVERWNSRHG